MIKYYSMLQHTMENPSSIQVSQDTKQLFTGLKNYPTESFEQLMIRLYINIKENDDDLLTKEDIAEIEDSLNEIKKGNYKTQAQMKEKYGLK